MSTEDFILSRRKDPSLSRVASARAKAYQDKMWGDNTVTFDAQGNASWYDASKKKTLKRKASNMPSWVQETR